MLCSRAPRPRAAQRGKSRPEGRLELAKKLIIVGQSCFFYIVLPRIMVHFLSTTLVVRCRCETSSERRDASHVDLPYPHSSLDWSDGDGSERAAGYPIANISDDPTLLKKASLTISDTVWKSAAWGLPVARKSMPPRTLSHNVNLAELRAVAHNPEALHTLLRSFDLSIGARKRLELQAKSPIYLLTTDGIEVAFSVAAAGRSAYVRSALQFAACSAQQVRSVFSVPFSSAEIAPVVAICEGTPCEPLCRMTTAGLLQMLHVGGFLQIERVSSAAAAALSLRCRSRAPLEFQQDLGLPLSATTAGLDEALFASPQV